jgi:hypothetical protein
MSVILQAPVIYQAPLTDSQKMEITEYVNKYRKAHQAPNLTWDESIANFSQSWSNYLINNNLFQHSGSQLYGENLAYFRGYGSDIMTLLKLSIDLWYKEIEYYNFNKPGFSDETGHFTCLIWKKSTKFGMGISVLDNTVVVSFNTTPPCNIIGQFDINVLPKIENAELPQPPTVPVPIAPIPSPIIPQEEEFNVPPNKIIMMITTLHSIIEELKKPNSNKVMIIHYLKNIVKQLINYS